MGGVSWTPRRDEIAPGRGMQVGISQGMGSVKGQANGYKRKKKRGPNS